MQCNIVEKDLQSR